ncbi:unnamed protein product [Ectocarpus sp. CCAP 1310/34]|nr:unnamed protein product [Ectocarpus sp. CCAP 1310/34]
MSFSLASAPGLVDSASSCVHRGKRVLNSSRLKNRRQGTAGGEGREGLFCVTTALGPDAAATTNHGSAKLQEGQPKPAQAGESAGASASVAPSQSSHHPGYFHALVGDGRDSDNNSSASDGAKAGIQTLDTDPPPDDDDDDDDNADDDLAHDILQNRADAASQQSAPLVASGGPLEAVLVSAVTKAVETEKAPPAWVLSMLMPGAAHQQNIQKQV